MVIVCPLVYIWGFYICMHTTMTICKICKIDKEDTRENWYFHEWKRFWLKCKQCTLEWRKSEYERAMARERDRERYYNNPKRREYIFKTSKERKKRTWHTRIYNRVKRKSDKLWVRPRICPICWYEWRIVAHHPDYSKPYEIVFCCQICHDKIHRQKIECPTPIDLKNI